MTATPPERTAQRRAAARGWRALAGLTGLWLGLWQVVLSWSLLATGGAVVRAWVVLTAAWLCGGALGALAATWGWVARRGVGSLRAALGVALLSGAAAMAAASRFVFTAWPVAALLAAALCGGLYAGLFLAHCGRASRDVRSLFLWENNGFLVGYAVGFAGMLTVGGWTLPLAGVLGAVLLCLPQPSEPAVATADAAPAAG